MTPRRRRRRWGTVVVCFIFSIAFIAFGTYFTWARHSGVPQRITIQSCHQKSGSRASDVFINYIFGDSCQGSPGNPTEGRYLEYWGVYRKDVGRDIDVHITRGTGVFDEAVNDAWIVPQIAIGIGGALGVAAVVGIVRRLRPAPVEAGRPWPGVTS